MFTLNFLIRITVIFMLLAWEAYWIISGKKADKEKPKSIPSTFKTRSKMFLTTEAIGFLVFLQLVGIPLLSFSYYSLAEQFIGLLFVITGIIVSVTGRIQLGTNWAHAGEYQIKQKHELVANGIYQYIRHPIYLGIILASTGAELVAQSYIFIIFFLGFSILTYIQGKKEEQLLMKHFGKSYEQYMKQSKMFIPLIW